MRQVALLLVALSLVATIPAHAISTPGDGSRVGTADECSNSATSAQPCLRFDTADQARPLHHVFLWAAAAKCTPTVDAVSPFGNECGGRPAKTVAPGVPPLGVLGLLYEDSNGVDGLQRARGVASQPDGMILI